RLTRLNLCESCASTVFGDVQRTGDAAGETTPVKKRKYSQDEKCPELASPPLSPEQLDRILRNRAAALQKLAAHLRCEKYVQGIGVLLLNAVLTVRAHNANSHKDRVWEKFTPSVISWLNKNLNGVVFMLWGAYAQKKGSNIDRKRHHVLQTVHPLPLSVHRGFYGCRHFSKTNVYLKDTGRELIDWKAL
uniref:Uracil-DNA glycosylase-like domain-containing protein n=1 Tax=Leptobrachium leishanense TaxID=445787 RepID=A0A8C5P6B4_9ANUR